MKRHSAAKLHWTASTNYKRTSVCSLHGKITGPTARWCPFHYCLPLYLKLSSYVHFLTSFTHTLAPNLFTLVYLPIYQGCTTRGPWAGSGPRTCYIRPSEQVKIQETSPE